MNESLSAKRRASIALGAAALLVLSAALLASRSPALGMYARGLEFAILGGSFIMAVAFAVAIPCGIVAASGPRAFDSALRFLCNCVSSLPTVFIAAVLWAWSTRTLVYLSALGLLHGLELAWLLRCEAVRLEASDHDFGPRALGSTPLVALVRQRLPASIGPVLVSASFSIAWLTALDAALTQAGLRPPAAPPTWGPLLGAPNPNPLASILAAGSVALLTAALHTLFRPPARSAIDNS
ncbi:MAG TPA: ABC transporter permease subunit [Polyangiaceae bacterium]|nr:ABC transporter permease subunit [Polyangiaceae bacterium]